MALNPPVTESPMGKMPLHFQGEQFLVCRPVRTLTCPSPFIMLSNVCYFYPCTAQNVVAEVDEMPNGTWRRRCTVFISDVRVVALAEEHDGRGRDGQVPSGIDMPLVYIRNEKVEQPLFGANALSGRCFKVDPNGGPQGELPPHDFRLRFKSGGCGTFVNAFFSVIDGVRSVEQGQQAPSSIFDPDAAYVDPNDPTTVHIPHDPSNCADSAPPSYPLREKKDS